MAIGLQTFIPARSVGIGDWVDILTSSVSATTGFGGILLQGKSWIVGGVTFPVTLGSQSDCFFAVDVAPVSTDKPKGDDPPFPPVWPYPTGPIYQREHFGMNLLMIRKDDYVFDFAASLNGAALDLTGATLRFTAKYDNFDADASAVIRLDNAGLGGVTITSAASGLGTVEIPSAATASLPNHRTRLYYALRATLSTGKAKTIRRGWLIVMPNTSDP